MVQYCYRPECNWFVFWFLDVFCGDDGLPTKKEVAATSKDTVHLKWCTPKTTAAPGYSWVK